VLSRSLGTPLFRRTASSVASTVNAHAHSGIGVFTLLAQIPPGFHVILASHAPRISFYGSGRGEGGQREVDAFAYIAHVVIRHIIIYFFNRFLNLLVAAIAFSPTFQSSDTRSISMFVCPRVLYRDL